MNIPECGYLYIAVGEKYLKEATVSVASLKRIDKKSHVTLITDKEYKNNLFDRILICPMRDDPEAPKIKGIRNSIWSKESLETFAYRIRCFCHRSLYNKTIYLDTDTYFYDTCDEIFVFLDYFDICLALAPRDYSEICLDNRKIVNPCLYNCGIIAFRKNSKNDFLFREWYRIYLKKLENVSLGPLESDQSSFVEALAKSESRLYSLPNEYNAGIRFFIALNKPARIVHGRCGDYEKLGKRINKKLLSHRVWHLQTRKCISQSIFHIRVIKSFVRFILNNRRNGIPIRKSIKIIQNRISKW